MKKLLLFLLLLMPFMVYADDSKPFYVACNPADAGSDFSCTIYGPTSLKSASMTLILPDEDGFTLKSNTANDGFTSNSNGINFSYEGPGINANSKIATFKASSPKNPNWNSYQIVLNNVKYRGTEDSDEVAVGQIKTMVQINEKTTTTTTTKKIEGPTTTTTTKKLDNPDMVKNKYTVKLHSNNEEGILTTLTCTERNGLCEIDLTQVDIPTKDGYKFTGWGTKDTCTKGNLDKYKVLSDTDLYACYEETGDSQLKLGSLEIENIEFDFNPNIYEYIIEVLYDVESLNVTASADDDSIDVDVVNPDTLEVGENTIKITLTKKDLSKDYVINVNRLAEGVELSSDKSLMISITNHPFDFNPNIHEYSLNLESKETELEIIIENLNEGDNYKIENNANLENGSIVYLTILDDENNEVIYSFNIIKNDLSFIQKYQTYLLIGGGLLLLILLYIIYKSKQKPTNKNDNSKKEEKKEIPTSSSNDADIEILEL